MQLFYKIQKIFITIAIFTIAACSNEKNTLITRTFHNLTAKYNLYFNANESLKAGIKKAKKNYKEDYSGILPVFIYDKKEVAALLTSEMDRSIKKCAKSIKIHSLEVKPKKKKSENAMNKKELEFYNKSEYCKWIDDTYLLMGIAHFYKMEYQTAELTFQLVIKKYKSENSRYDALFWLAKNDVQTKNYERAVKNLKILKKLKDRPERLNHEMDLLYAHLYMKQKKYKLAIPKLIAAIENEKNKNDKARFIYIISQIYKQEGKFNRAAKNLRKVIKLNSNYDMTFSAKIRLAEIYEKTNSKGKNLKNELLKMAKDEKNVDYLDQIYYALGKIELDEENTAKAIEYFSKSANSQSSSKTQKVKTYSVLAEYYYSKENYINAEAYLDSTLTAMDDSYPNYNDINKKYKAFRNISQNKNIIYMQDSLIALSKMPEKERNKIINNQIRKVIQKEKEKEKREKEQTEFYDPRFSNNNNSNTVKGGKWYFYNATSLSYGQTEFKKKWGDRKLEDNWRRSNKTISVDITETNDTSSQSKNNKEPKFNNKKKEYYIKDIPLTKEALAISHTNIENAYFKNGEIYYRKLSENKNAIKSFNNLLNNYHKTNHRLETLNYLYRINNEIGNNSEAEKYKNQIIKEYPNSIYAKIISDPNFLENQNKKIIKANDLYKQAYTLYKNQNYMQTIDICNKSLENNSSIELDANFLFLKAMSYGELGIKKKLKENLYAIIEKFPDKDITKDAKNILAVIESGTLVMDIYNNELDSVHYYVLIIPKGKTDINKIIFNVLEFNVDNYTQYELNIDTISDIVNKDIILVKSFKNATLAKSYFNLLKSKKINKQLSILPHNQFIISKNNYKILLKDKSIDKYLKFYNKTY